MLELHDLLICVCVFLENEFNPNHSLIILKKFIIICKTTRAMLPG